jgi:hypothetical protein
VWLVSRVSAVLVAVFSVVMSIVADRAGTKVCGSDPQCDPHGYFTIFYVLVGVVLTGLSVAAYWFCSARSEAGPALGLLISVLLLGFVAGAVEEMPGWLKVATWIVGGWFLLVSLAGLLAARRPEGETPAP